MGKKGKRKNQAEKHKKTEQSARRELICFKSLDGKLKYINYAPAAAALAAGFYFVYSALKSNGFFGFPLDDPWIHLTFAKNLVEFGSFSYFKDEVVTSGSTSPLYTLFLSLFFLIIKNEFIVSYIHGIVFGTLTIYFVMKLFQKINDQEENRNSSSFQIIVITAAFLTALQPKLNLINVSGMETPMFIFCIAVSLYAYISKRMVLLGIFLGLTVWCRPDGLVLWGAVLPDYFIQQSLIKRNEKENFPEKKSPKILTAFSVAFIFLAAYFSFNYFLSGSLLPNTYSAKLEYYQDNDRSSFLQNEVVGYFTRDEFSLIWIPFIIGVIGILKSLLKKKYNGLFVLLLFITGLIAVYYIKLPFAHRFGRYLMPVIPFYVIIAVYGVKLLIDFISVRMIKENSKLPNIIFALYSVTVAGFAVYYNSHSVNDYTFFSSYHNKRHVAAGNWIKENTVESDVIATHDIGAIAFYSGRKIVDMAGLVTPELIDQMNKPSYSDYLNRFLAEQNTDYIAVLRNWFEIVNDYPVFVPVNEPEFLEIFKYDHLRTYIQPRQVSYLNQTAVQMAQKGYISDAAAYLTQSLRIDNKSSQTFYLLGAVHEMNKDHKNAEKNFRRAVNIFPEYAEANYGLAKISFDLNKMEEAKNYVERTLAVKPDFSPALDLKKKLNPSVIN